MIKKGIIAAATLVVAIGGLAFTVWTFYENKARQEPEIVPKRQAVFAETE